jgi:uncharacterized delta-60 repeat protein
MRGTGKIVVAVGDAALDGGRTMIAARLTGSGLLDTAFADDGVAEIDWPSSPSDSARGVVVDSAGRITMAGYIEVGDEFRFALARLTSAGVLDTSFSDNGMYDHNWSQSIFGHDLALSPDGRHLAVTGSFGASDSQIAVARYNTRHTNVPGWPALTASLGAGGPTASADRVFRHPSRDINGPSSAVDIAVQAFSTLGARHHGGQLTAG